MKKRFALAIAASLLSSVAMAQTTTTNNMPTANLTGNTTSQASTQADSAANNAGNAQLIQFNSDNGGTSKTTLKTAPALGGQSFHGSFSPDSCVTAAGGGGSVTGFALNLAAPVTDKHCMALRAYERTMQGASGEENPAIRAAMKNAARDIMCQSSEETRLAYTKAGLCSPEFAQAPVLPTVAQQNQRQQVAQARSLDSFYAQSGN